MVPSLSHFFVVDISEGQPFSMTMIKESTIIICLIFRHFFFLLFQTSVKESVSVSNISSNPNAIVKGVRINYMGSKNSQIFADLIILCGHHIGLAGLRRL